MHCKAITTLLAAVCAQSVVFGSYQHGSVAKPVVLESGYLADTHEVAAAKSAHLAALAKGTHGHGHEGDYDHSFAHGHEGDYDHSYGQAPGLRYHGPTAIPHVLKNGHLSDTHEVAAAKADHYAAVANAKTHGGYGYAGDYGYGHGSYEGDYDHSYGHGHNIRYHGPTAIPHVLKNGHIADTHEVAAAKADHYAAVATAKTHGGYGYAGDYEYSHGGYSGSYEGDYDHSYGHGHNIRYHGPTAIPHVLKNGHIADTHEVAAAKADHYAAVATAKTHGGYGYAGDYGYSHGHGSSSYGQGYSHQRYHGALAKPVVLPSGYLADTHEVQAARHQHLGALHSNHY